MSRRRWSRHRCPEGDHGERRAIALPADVGGVKRRLRQARPATGEPPGVTAGRAGSAITTSNGSQAASHSQVSAVAGAENVNLFVATDGMVVIRPNRAKLWAIIRGGTRFWPTAS
jgi:hypothetical protein